MPSKPTKPPQSPEVGTVIKRVVKPHQIIILMGPDDDMRRSAARAAYTHITQVRVRSVHHIFDNTIRAALSLIGDEYSRNDYSAVIPGLLTLFSSHFGEDWLGNSLLHDMKRAHNADATIIPDALNLDELKPIIQHYDIKNCHLIDIQSSGLSCDEQLILTHGVLINYQQLIARHDPAMFKAQVLRRVDKILGIEGREYKL